MNNDRFKFRVWDVLGNKYSTEVGYWVSDDGNLHLRDLLCEPGYWIPEQCTGLRDRNGKLRYEGDVIKVDSPYPDGSRREVCWYKGQWDANGEGLSYLCRNHSVKVIGNIHETEVK